MYGSYRKIKTGVSLFWTTQYRGIFYWCTDNEMKATVYGLDWTE